MSKYRNYFFFFLYLISRPHIILLLFKKIYIPIYIQYEWLKTYNIKTIIDIGANHGHVSHVLNYLFPKATIYAFEPIKSECLLINKRLKNSNIFVENVALSNKIGKTKFFVNEHNPSSSMLQLLKHARNNIPTFLGKEKKITVKATTLDYYFKNKKIRKDVFMKIDVQGAEKMVFEGGKNFLRYISIIHIETSFSKIYKNQCLFEDIYNFLTSYGFVYFGSVNDSNFYPSFKLPLQENSIFIKRK